MSIFEAKKELRTQIRRRRARLDPLERKEWDSRIESRVLSMEEYRRAGTVFCFVSCGGEPDTMGILKAALSGGKRLAVPRCISDGIMEAVEITSLAQLSQKGSYGILEPDEGLPTLDFSLLDFAVVPGLAYTPDGRRLGQGGGYYDRFMAATSAYTCGICYGCFLMEDVPVGPFDMTVVKVVTEL